MLMKIPEANSESNQELLGKALSSLVLILSMDSFLWILSNHKDKATGGQALRMEWDYEIPFNFICRINDNAMLFLLKGHAKRLLKGLSLVDRKIYHFVNIRRKKTKQGP